MASSRFLNFAALGFFLAVIVTAFWQIETDFKEQGIASGGPYDNAASFPWAIAVIIGVLLGLQLIVELQQYLVLGCKMLIMQHHQQLHRIPTDQFECFLKHQSNHRL